VSKHTPGPWDVVHNSWEVSTVYAASGEVARCHIDSEVTEDTQDTLEPIKEANARLISAAPDLLKASKRALNVFKAQGESVRPGSVLGALADAINKAEGQS
jgi:hypothetical protein